GRLAPDAPAAAADVCDLRTPHRPALQGLRVFYERKGLDAPRTLSAGEVAGLSGGRSRAGDDGETVRPPVAARPAARGPRLRGLPPGGGVPRPGPLGAWLAGGAGGPGR